VTRVPANLPGHPDRFVARGVRRARAGEAAGGRSPPAGLGL